MSDNKKIITAKEIEVVEKTEIAEDIDNVTDTNVDISILNVENVVDKDNNQHKSKYKHPVCHTDINLKNSFSCEEMCSKYCWYKKEEVDQSDGRYCHAECNTEECNYDQGDCKGTLIRL